LTKTVKANDPDEGIRVSFNGLIGQAPPTLGLHQINFSL